MDETLVIETPGGLVRISPDDKLYAQYCKMYGVGKRCPICCKEMEEIQEKTSDNKFWQCKECKISVDILNALRDPK